MSLSKFYKSNNSFQTTLILDSTANKSSAPIWESIVKKEAIPEVPIDNDILDTTILPEPDPAPKDTPEDNHLDEVEIPAILEKDPVPTPLPTPVAEPTIDLKILRESSFAAGAEAGRKQAEEDFENSAQTLLCICTELDRLRETILQNSAGEMKALVLAISEKIIRHSVTEQEETIVATIKDAIHLAVTSDAFQVQINPEDLKAVETRKQEIIDSISGLDNIVLKPDATVERGGCKLESDCCTVDASMISQIKVIHDSVMAEATLPQLAAPSSPAQSSSNDNAQGSA